jgi:phosphatidylserine/phosphatidylglycerophosphate/cardiolipin synthase-like enzyme
MEFAEAFALPLDGKLAKSMPWRNDFKDTFFIRWGRIRFQLFWGAEVNLKVILKVYREDTVEQYIVDTDPYDQTWNAHKRRTRDFYVHPFPRRHGPVQCVKFSYVVHYQGRSIPSEHEYIFMDGPLFARDQVERRAITRAYATPNRYRTLELDADTLQRDVDWYNHHFDSLRLTPKFTKGQPQHPFHPKTYIHDQIDAVIARQTADPHGAHSIKVSVDCIDDADFINHLIHAAECGVTVQCIVDWRKMMLTNSPNYARLKRASVELLGVFCTPQDPLIEVAPDMHTKFIIFDGGDAILGSFNITFDRWWANWESGMTFRSQGVARLLDNIFQSIRGGVIQTYGVDPHSRFNLLYTFGRQQTLNGRLYRPHHAILSEIRRARHSIKLCLFLMGELQGAHQDSVVDALINAHRRGVDVRLVLNGHLARQGDPGREYTMAEELQRPLLPAVQRLKQAGVNVALAYGQVDQRVPYCPIHAKYCIIDDHVVLDGSFNWYNTSVFSHDLLVVAADTAVAQPYLHEFNQILHDFRIYA